MSQALRKCTLCGLEAIIPRELELFVKNKIYKHGRKNLCKVCSNLGIKKHYQKTKERRNRNSKEYQKKRRKIDPLFKLKRNMRNNVKRYIQDYKSKRTEEIIGVSWEVLQKHLNWSCYENYGLWPNEIDQELHVDHIIPQSSATSEEELYSLNHFLNLQYLTATDNLVKGDKTPKSGETLNYLGEDCYTDINCQLNGTRV